MIVMLLILIVAILLFGAASVKSGVGNFFVLIIALLAVGWIGSLFGLSLEVTLLVLFLLGLGLAGYMHFFHESLLENSKRRKERAIWDSEAKRNTEARKKEEERSQ